MKLFGKLKSSSTFFKPQKEKKLNCDLVHKLNGNGCIILALLKLNTVNYQPDRKGFCNEE